MNLQFDNTSSAKVDPSFQLDPDLNLENWQEWTPRTCHYRLQHAPNDHHARHRLALLSFDQGKFDVAVRLIEDLVEFAPD